MTIDEAKAMLQPGVVLEFMRDMSEYTTGDCITITHIAVQY